MSNASRCRETAARFAKLAALSDDAEERGACRELERLWSEMAALAERFDRERDDAAKAAIYAMMGEVEQVRHRATARTEPSPLVAEGAASLAKRRVRIQPHHRHSIIQLALIRLPARTENIFSQGVR